MKSLTKRLLAGCLAALVCLAAFTCCSSDSPDSGKTTEKQAESVPSGDSSGSSEKKENDLEDQPSSAPETVERTEAVVSLSEKSGVYQGDIQLEITAEDSSAQIYYTTDGSDPATSDTAILYDGPVTISDNSGSPNVVSAVDPTLFCGNLNQPKSDRSGFDCNVSAPQDSAVDKCAVIRAAAKSSDGSFSQDAGGVYFFGSMADHIQGLAESCSASGSSLAVINLSMNYSDLFDPDYGIYVKGSIFDKALEEFIASGEHMDAETARSLDANYKQKGREWEREAYLTFMECSPDGAEQVLSQRCGVRIQGNYSRSDLQKGLRLYARKDYGDNNFNYAVFGENYLNDSGEVMDKFKTLTLRAGGNTALSAKFNDTYWQSLVKDLDCETQTSRPCVVYINGEYWGLYVLQEDYSNDYFEDLHGVDKKDVVVYKGDAEALSLGYKLDEGDLPEGESESYYFNDLLDFFSSHKDLKSDDDYRQFCKLVDQQSVMDYFAVQCWINNKWDWPGKNWSMWRTINTDPSNGYADGRWRFLFYDIDFGGVSGSSDAYTNTIKDDNYKPLGLLDTDTNNPAVLCFAYLMTNEDFRNDFCDELSSLSDGVFQQQKALDKLQEFEDIYSPLYDQFFERYPGAGSAKDAVSGGYSSISCIRDFLSLRKDYIQPMIEYVRKTLG